MNLSETSPPCKPWVSFYGIIRNMGAYLGIFLFQIFLAAFFLVVPVVTNNFQLAVIFSKKLFPLDITVQSRRMRGCVQSLGLSALWLHYTGLLWSPWNLAEGSIVVLI
jgi:hypothetical protein